METLYTIIVEFDGSTYISQITASTPSRALLRWTRERHRTKGDGPPRKVHSRVGIDLREQAPTTVEGCRNVWCFSSVAGKDLILIHIVSTSN